MCDSIEGYCDIYENSRIKARKPRKCDACDEVIAKSHFYHRETMLFDSQWENTNRCLRCEAIYQHLSIKMSKEDMAPRPALDCGEVYQDPPESIARLAFITADEAQVEFAK